MKQELISPTRSFEIIFNNIVVLEFFQLELNQIYVTHFKIY